MARAISFAEREAILHRWRNRFVSEGVLSFSEVGSLLLGLMLGLLPSEKLPRRIDCVEGWPLTIWLIR